MMNLQLIQLFVNPALGQKLLMSTLLSDFALVHDHDAVCVLDGGKPVGDHYGGAVQHDFFQGLLD